MRVFIFFLITTYCLFNSCNSTGNPSIPTGSEVPEDFSTFYELFHTDSAFQMDHILFPLDGRPAADTSGINEEDFEWSKKDWKMHSFDHFDPDRFEVDRKVTDSTLITEFILEKESGFGIKRRFAKFGDEWYLIYYDAMNPGQ